VGNNKEKVAVKKDPESFKNIHHLGEKTTLGGEKLVELKNTWTKGERRQKQKDCTH